MPSNEVRRLKRLRLDRLDADGVRTELARAIEAFEAETVAADTERKRLETVARNLTAEVQALRDRPAGPTISGPTLAGPTVAGPTLAADAFAPRLSQIETQLADLSSLRAEQGRIRDLVETLRLRDEVPRSPPKVMPTEDVVRSMAAAVAKAAADLPAGLAIGTVEVDVRGPLGTEGGQVTVALDPSRSAPEAVSSLRFSLITGPRTTRVE